MTDDLVPLVDDYLEAALELKLITLQLKDLAAREKACKEIIAKHLVEGQTGVDPDTGEALVQVTHGAKVWSEPEAMKNLPADLLQTLIVTKTESHIDKDRAQDILPPALYALCCKTNKASVKSL